MKPGYKQTEVGVIPEEWEVKPLRDLATIATGNTPPTSDPTNYGDEFPFVGPVDIGDSKFISRTEKMLSKKGFAMSRRFPEGSILFVCIGSTIGKCGIAPVELTSNQQINVIFPSATFSVDFLFYSVCAAAPRIKRQAGEQAVPIVNKSQFAENVVALPPLPEQRAIAEALSDMDGLLAALDRLIAKKRDLKQAAMQQLLTGQTRLPGFHGEWSSKKLGDIASLINGRAYALHEWESSGTPVIRLQNLTGRGEDFYYSNLTLPERQYCEHGDLLFMWSATFGPIIWRGPKAIFHYHIWKVLCHEECLDKGYFFHFLTDVTERLRGSSTSGGTMLHLTKSGMESMTMVVPSYLEQNAIAEVLSDMDAELASLEQRREKTRALKQGMMQELLTGRVRLA